MPTLSGSHSAAYDAVGRICESGLSSLDLLEQVAGRVRAAVPHECAGWLCADPATHLKIGAYVENAPPKVYAQLFENELLQNDVSKFEQIACGSRSATSLAVETNHDLARSSRYRDIYRPHGLWDEIRMVFRSGGAVLGMSGLVRARGSAPFQRSDLVFLEAIGTRIAEGLRRRLLLEESEPAANIGPGIVVLGPDDTVESITADGRRLLREITPESGTSLSLPTAVYHLALRVRAKSAFPARGRIRLRSGRWLLLAASRLLGERDREDRVAVLLEPVKPSQLAPFLVDIYPLTERERDVTQLLVQGVAITRIGETLNISRHTVRDHVKSIFAKLGVVSRPELMAKLFHDQFGSQLSALAKSGHEPAAAPRKGIKLGI